MPDTPTLRDLLADKIRTEAAQYSGDVADGACVNDEDTCMAAHIHEAWSVDGVIGSVRASPDGLARSVTTWVAAWLRSDEAWTVTAKAYTDHDNAMFTHGQCGCGGTAASHILTRLADAVQKGPADA